MVGESGCGKSSTGRALCGLSEHTKGHAWFCPSEQRLAASPSLAELIDKFGIGGRVDLLKLNKQQWRPLRPSISMVFQDSATALNPRLSIGDSVAEPLEVNKRGSSAEIKRRVVELFELVGIDPQRSHQRPANFSGGQRQRICIARAVALNPELIICDEIVSALDVVVQKQILQLLEDIQNKFGTALLFISHDLAVVSNVAEQVAVMQGGQLVEKGPVAKVFGNPQHRCTQELIKSIPRL